MTVMCVMVVYEMSSVKSIQKWCEAQNNRNILLSSVDSSNIDLTLFCLPHLILLSSVLFLFLLSCPIFPSLPCISTFASPSFFLRNWHFSFHANYPTHRVHFLLYKQQKNDVGYQLFQIIGFTNNDSFQSMPVV